jgi:hypothetical protein
MDKRNESEHCPKGWDKGVGVFVIRHMHYL